MEFSATGTSENWMGFFFGICIIFMGIYLLSPPDPEYEEGAEHIDEDGQRLR